MSIVCRILRYQEIESEIRNGETALCCVHTSPSAGVPLFSSSAAWRAFINFLANTSKPPFQQLLLFLIQLLLLQTRSRKIIVKTPAALYSADNSFLHEAIKQPFEFNTTVYFRKVLEIFPHLFFSQCVSIQTWLNLQRVLE